MAELDQAFGFDRSANVQVAGGWFLLVVRSDYQPAYQRLEEYLKSTGRTSLIVPLYAELVKTPAGATLANASIHRRSPFTRRRPSPPWMQWSAPMPRATMTSEWMKVMLEEIERKKAEAEQARIEEERRALERRTREGMSARNGAVKG